MTEKRTEITVSEFEGKVKAFLSETSLLSSLSAPASRGELPPPMEKSVPEEATVIRLPEPDMLPDLAVNFLETVELRTSVRVYGEEPVTQKELSALLWCTQGVKMALPGGKSIRNVPSAGGRHSFETYLLIQNVEGIKPGLYRFLAFAHALLFVKDIECAREKVIGSFPQRSLLEGSAVVFLWTSIAERSAFMFGARALRYVFIDVGHVCQNLYLIAQVMKLGVSAIGAFSDEALNDALGVDGVQEFSIYAAAVGRL